MRFQMTDFAQNLRRAAGENMLSITELAKRAKIGRSRLYGLLGHGERPPARPKTDELLRLREVLGWSIDALLGCEDDLSPPVWVDENSEARALGEKILEDFGLQKLVEYGFQMSPRDRMWLLRAAELAAADALPAPRSINAV